jgi:hypothetical protein
MERMKKDTTTMAQRNISLEAELDTIVRKSQRYGQPADSIGRCPG